MPLDTKGKFSLPTLPYAENALEPVISARTISFHYGKHHKAYVDKLNELVAGTPYESMTLEEIVRKAAKSDKDKAIFNTAGQAWTHTFYWESMAPKGGAPSGKILDALKSSFGGVKEFNEAFAKAAVAQFGSGWAWLVKGADGKVSIESSPNQDSPVMDGKFPVLGCDVWEHAYYLKYQNRRADYLAAWWNVVNWAVAGRRYDSGK